MRNFYPLSQNKDVSSLEEYEERQPFVTSASDAIKGSFELAIEDTAVGVIGRNMAISELEKNGMRPISPEEANERFPGMEIPFRDPVNPVVAQYLYDRQMERMKIQEKIMSGPQNMAARAAYMGAGIAAHLMDPLEVGASMVTGWALGGLAVRGAFGARIGAAARGSRMGMTNYRGRLAAELPEVTAGNLAENTAQEIAIAGISEREGLQYDAVEGMANIAISTMAGAAFGLSIKELSFQLGRSLKRQISETSPEADLAVFRTGVAQQSQDIRPDASPIIESLARETDINPELVPRARAYEYSPMDMSQGPKVFYMSAKAGDTLFVGDNYGGGRQLTDNPNVANATAARGMSGSVGQVMEVRLEKLNALDLNAPIPENLRAVVNDFLKESGGASGGRMDFVGESSMRDILDDIRAAIDEGDLDGAIIDQLKDVLKKKGYDSWFHDGSKRLGYEHSKHNVLEIFDDAKIPDGALVEVDPSVRADPGPDLMRRAENYNSDPRNNQLLDMDTHAAMKERVDSGELNQSQDIKEFSKRIDEIIDDLDQLEKQGLLESQMAEFKNEIRELKAMKDDVEFEHKLLKAVKSCVG